MKQLFRLDNRKFSFADCWSLGSGPSVVILILCKILRLRVDFPLAPLVESAADLSIEPSQMPPEVWQLFEPKIADISELGFSISGYQCLRNDMAATDAYAVLLLHASGEVLAKVATVSAPGTKRRLITDFGSVLKSRRHLSTSDSVGAHFADAEWSGAVRVAKATPAQLWERHQQRLNDVRPSDRPMTVRFQEEYTALCDELETRGPKERIASGIYVPVSPEETSEVQARLSPSREAANGDPQMVAILDQMQQLINPKQAGWGQTIWIFALSALLFTSAGASKWSGQFLEMLLVVLFVHELGHYLAMRLFHYRNVKMFFIPFFGAAVSGTRFSAPAYKKAIVSLMGPVPGIFIGAALTWYAIAHPAPKLVPLAEMFLFINGFNLLPLLPLDGGWFFHAIFFSRWRWLEAAFRGLTGVGLVLLALALHSRLLAIPGIFMVLSVGATYQAGSIARKLRGEIPADQEEAEQITPAVGRRIVEEVRAAMPKLDKPRAVATVAVSVFEKMSAQPPSVLATLGLTTTYGVTILAALLFWSTAVVARSPHAREEMLIREINYQLEQEAKAHPESGKARRVEKPEAVPLP